MSKCIIYFFKEFKSNQYGLTIETNRETFSTLLPIDNENQIIGGVLDRNKLESLRDFLNILLNKEEM